MRLVINHSSQAILLGLFLIAAQSTALAQNPGNPIGFTGGDGLFPDFFAPSSGSGPFSEISWTRTDSSSSFAAWENFETVSAANSPAIEATVTQIPTPGGPIDFVTGIQDTPEPFLVAGGAASITYTPAFNENAPIITSTRNLYTSSSFGQFDVTVSGEGLGEGNDTRVVIQVGTLGNVQAGGSFLLEYTDAEGENVTLSPIFNDQLGLGDSGSPMGGVSEQRALVWNIPGFNPDEYRISFQASQFISVSSVIVDSFTQAAITPVLGDYSGDGLVNEGDVTAFVNQFGTVGFNSDGNNDDEIDAADFVILRDVLPSGPPAAAISAAVVPEPASVLLGACSVLGIAVSYGRQR